MCELDQNPPVALCYSRAKIVDERGVYVVDYDPGPDTSSLNPHERFRNLLLYPEYAIQQMGLIRSEVLKKTSLHQSFPSSDEVLLAELALLGQFYAIPDRLYLYRRHSEHSTKESKQRARVLFFDTALAGKILLPKWLYFLACLNVVTRSSLSLSGQMHCFATMLRWFFVPAHFRALAKDLLIAANELMVCAFSKYGQASTGDT